MNVRAFLWSAAWGVTSALRAMTRELDTMVRAKAAMALREQRA